MVTSHIFTRFLFANFLSFLIRQKMVPLYSSTYFLFTNLLQLIIKDYVLLKIALDASVLRP